MEILDEKGRLFGAVNVVDALVVLLVLAVVAAGAALVLGGNDSTPDDSDELDLASTHATLDMGTQPEYIVAQLNEGDTYSPGGNDNLTVTDVHLEPRSNGDAAALLRVRLRRRCDERVVPVRRRTAAARTRTPGRHRPVPGERRRDGDR